MQRLLNDWYAKVGQLIGEFRETYADTASQSAAAES
jgi:predicted transcriptional regulator